MDIDPALAAAARGDIPERFSPVVAAQVAADGSVAVVLFDTDPGGGGYPYLVVCHRHEGGWEEGPSGNGYGWAITSDDAAPERGVLTWFDEAPAGARVAVLSVYGEQVTVPVSDGYALLAVFDVPCPEDVDWPVELVGFS